MLNQGNRYVQQGRSCPVLNLTPTQQAGDKMVFSSHCVFVASNKCASQH